MAPACQSKTKKQMNAADAPPADAAATSGERGHPGSTGRGSLNGFGWQDMYDSLPSPGYNLRVADPPAYAIPLNGIPIARKSSEGFRSLGKLVGAHRKLWTAGCKALINDILDESPLESSQLAIPLFDLLSAHQRVRLLREVAVGLLCNDRPLPADTVWHYSAYFAPMHFVSFVAIDVEIDDEKMMLKFSQPGQSRNQKTWEDIHIKIAEATRKAEERKALREKADQDKKAQPKLRKSTNMLISDFRDQAMGESLDETERDAYMRNFYGKASTRPRPCDSYKARQEEYHREDPDAFAWRMLMHDFIRQRIDPRMLLSIGSHLLPGIFELDRDAWLKSYYAVFFMTIQWPDEKNELFDQLLFRPLVETEYNARAHLVRRTVRRSSKKFLETWTPEGSANDFRYLAVLMEKDDPTIHLDSCLSAGKLADDDGTRALCELGFCSWSWTDEEMKVEKAALENMRRGTAGNKDDEDDFEDADSIIDELRRWSWAHLWHEEMSNNPTMYQSPDARVRAVVAAATKAAIGSDESAKTAWKHSPCVGFDVDIASMTPAEYMTEKNVERCDNCSKRETDSVELHSCSRCGIALYCSEDCQRKAWPMHKRVCKGLKKIVNHGEGAATLPLDVFQEELKRKFPFYQKK